MSAKRKDYRTLALDQLECLRVHAKRNKLSDDAIAAMTGISRPNVSRILSGKNVPRLDTFMRLCDALDLPFVDICKNRIS